jgi:hypothetical protein
MHVFLWILQIVLGLMFLAAGVMKSTQPREKLREKLPWVEDVSDGTLRLIGVPGPGIARSDRHCPDSDSDRRDRAGIGDGARRDHPRTS